MYTFLLFLTAGLLTGCSSAPKDPIEISSFKLNTVVSIKIYDSTDEQLLKDCLAICDKYELLFSRTKKESEIYQLNHGLLADASGASPVSEDTLELLNAGLKYCDLSEGKFDIAITPLTELWDFTAANPSVPDVSLIEDAITRVNYQDILLEENQVTFAKENMGIDLGAIAKGYIADQIKEYLLSKGVKSAMINLGGNVLCVGNKPDGSPFKIGIQKPFADRNETIATMDISDKSVVSSGIYERFFEQDGVLYHHILNPETGYPYENNLIAVTIISDKSVDGDGLSTSCFALGLEKGLELVNSLENVHAIFITNDDEIHYSENFESLFNVQKSE